MKTIVTDVLVIGSGFGAAAPALRLAEAGVKVLIIEKGPNIVPETDFKMTQDPQYLMHYLKGISSDNLGLTYAEALGGGSGFYEMVSLRAPSRAFEQRDANNRRLWPATIDRSTMDPYYDMAEQMLNVEQIAPADVPATGLVFSRLMKNLGYSCERARYAVKGCIGSGYCVTGCVFGAKQSLHLNYLPRAVSAGAEIMTDMEALSIAPTLSRAAATRPLRGGAAKSLPHNYEVSCRQRVSGESITIRCRLLILGGGTVGSAALLLNSRQQLPRLSSHVGRNMAFNGSVKACALLPEGCMDGDMLSGRTHPGMISYEFLDSLGVTISAVKPMPVNIVSAAHFYLEGGSRAPAYWGESNVELMKQYRRRMIILYALGMTPPNASLTLDSGGKCSPRLEIDAPMRRYHADVKRLLESILTRNGCRLLRSPSIDREGKEHSDLHFSTAHMVGSCRMADNRKNGVVDAGGEVFGYPGMFVSDGAAVPTSLAVNTSLTILANAERIAERVVSR